MRVICVWPILLCSMWNQSSQCMIDEKELRTILLAPMTCETFLKIMRRTKLNTKTIQRYEEQIKSLNATSAQPVIRLLQAFQQYKEKDFSQTAAWKAMTLLHKKKPRHLELKKLLNNPALNTRELKPITCLINGILSKITQPLCPPPHNSPETALPTKKRPFRKSLPRIPDLAKPIPTMAASSEKIYFQMADSDDEFKCTIVRVASDDGDQLFEERSDDSWTESSADDAEHSFSMSADDSEDSPLLILNQAKKITPASLPPFQDSSDEEFKSTVIEHFPDDSDEEMS